MLGISLYSIICLYLAFSILRMPSVAIAPLLCMFGFEQWAQSMDSFFTKNSEFTNILVGLLVVFGMVVVMFSRRRSVGAYPGTAYAIIVLFLYALISLLWTPRIDLAEQVWLNNSPYLIVFIGLAPLLVNGTESLRQAMIGVLVMGGLVVVLILLFSEWKYRFIVLQGVSLNYGGGNPLAVSQMAGYVVLAALFLNVNRTKLLQWIVSWILIGCCMFVIVKTGSRGQFFGLFASAALFGFLKYSDGGIGRVALTIFSTAILAGIGLWVLVEFSEAERWTTESLGTQGLGRLEMARVLLNHWYSTPITMLFGLGNSASYVPRIIGIYPHIVPVEILCEEGIVGIALYGFILIRTIKSLRNLFKLTTADLGRRGLVALLGAMFMFDFLLSLKQGSLLTHYDIFTLVIVIGRYELLIIKEQAEENNRSKNDLETEISASPYLHVPRK